MNGLQKILLIHVLRCLGQIAHGSNIINGKAAPENAMQYMVSVQNNNGHVCGGFLVTEDFVVTAAHCDIENPTHVVLSNHNLKKGHQIKIKNRIKHSSYQNVWLGNDIMLLKLSRKAQLGCHVQIIQLPCAEINLKENEICQVAGWGKTRTGGETVDQLREVDVSVINPQVCREQWPGLPANVICAGGYGTNKGFCQGDSGDPLVYNGLVVGVASFNKNYNCTYPDVPNIYTDISKYLPWINEILTTS
ncbi:duodenase-1-like isoform X2 [Archocentrus centrarchus]|uniref:duodenase-1-like isoform X2 n=1 Tax=Archocentrus centrarchus TaxID=63155 RepID=UPI0011E9B53F|nr:duodenase-1-like isoform X2 [Archocentrus centrarchus]